MPAITVPDFPAALDWINSPPLSLQGELRGKIVILDFWTYCCINCMHVLPELATLEHKYADAPVVFIGVHSPKFANEQDTKQLRQAVLRYDVRHPVVNDAHRVLWNQLGVRGWPTLVVLGPAAQLVMAVSGEGHYLDLDQAIEGALKSFAGELNASPLAFQPEQAPQSTLLFPGKIAAASDALYIADSGHNRILVTDPDGQMLDTIGSGTKGHVDGRFNRACFNRPQGVVCQGSRVYIADTENHAIRVADLATKEVTTLARDLNSPWDLALYQNSALIAMAGSHQIWEHDFASGKTDLISGTGAEARLDGKRAAWAQPSGLAVQNNTLYVADSESSSIRSLNLRNQQVKTLAGGDRRNPSNLFAFGDAEGTGFEARLQHPLAVIWWPDTEQLIIADSYNHRLKLLDPITHRVETWIGDGQAGFVDGDPSFVRFSEPAGLAIIKDALFVADTNNHAIRHIDLTTITTTTLEIMG